ncbi:MAG: beta-ketoacyl-ACP synthase II [Chloroflexi bacterium]|nr:beta-ketoacyl-ACP synthase II [Chloroflexota bacterium]
MARRVVATGLGVISPVGLDTASTWESICAGRSGVGPISRFETSDYSTRIAAELHGYDPMTYFPGRESRRMDPFTQYAVVAAREAFTDSGLVIDDKESARTAVIIGSGIGGIGTQCEQLLVLRERGPNRVSPFTAPMILPDSAAGNVALELKLRGPNMAVISACASGANAIGEAYEMIRRGVCESALCGGAEASVLPLTVAGFSVIHALSERNDEPQRASRPFDKDRDGFVIGEGAAVLMLEEREHALARGAHPYAELVGYASTDDAYHIVAPEPEGAGAAACMRQALDSGAIDPQAIGYINAHGTSTPLNDITETLAIKQVFGEHAFKLAVSSTKSMTGHLLGAAGALEAIITIKVLQEGILPPTINLEQADPKCDLDYVPHTARNAQVEYALSNSFGFGGHNACLIFRKA